ncbi:MAG: ABC transporter ATP-binding protein [Ruminococcaceae bacterium]|nr:ABC transporter ATP-binding protein [Oscillospiraceae bacterium]
MIKRLFSYYKNYKIYAIMSPVLMLLEVIADVAIPMLMGLILNRVQSKTLGTEDIKYIILVGCAMVALALFAMFCGAYSNRLAAIASMGAGAELREELFVKIQSFSFADIDKFSTPSLITRMTTDVNNLQQSSMTVLRMAIRSPFMFLFALIAAMMISVKLACIFLVAVPILAIVIVVIMRKAHPRFTKFQGEIDNLNTSVQENLVNIRVVKTFVRENHEEEKFKKSNDSLTHTAINAIKLVIMNMPIMQLIIYACIIAILWFGSNLVLDTSIGHVLGTISEGAGIMSGNLMSLITYVTQILMSLMMLSMMFLQFTRARASADRIIEVLDTEPSLTNPAEPITQVRDGSIEFENVSFKYSGGTIDDTLKSINFSIKSGETIGIIGSTGSAKSTLVQLIPRLYDVTGGSVSVGGVNVKNYDLTVLRDSVAMVLQKNTLFSGTIRENMKWGDKEASDEEIIEALKHAQAWSFVSSFPNGLDTDLSQGGTNLSGGQKQRLCIARALLKKPKIIILDDSTSAVDMATDAKIMEAFEAELKDTTTIIIAQRIRSIQTADRIIVLDEGKLNAMGTHEELLESNEIYRDIYISQQEGVLAQ